MERTVPTPRWRRRDEQGTSLVEFALVVTLLCTLLLGIIVFGILLSKRQVLTQAAAEGARAAVPYQYTTATTGIVTNAAKAQVNKSLSGMDRACDDGSTTCTFTVYRCRPGDTTTTPPDGSSDCLQVKVDVAVGGTNPLVPTISILSPFLPSTMSSTFNVTLANPT